jgi:2-octaprenyl-6-methoxyphenol hydroxylase
MNGARDYDLLIVGGGMVGSSLALALAGRGLRIGLIEAVAPSIDAQPSYDDRAIALALGSRRFFAALDLWGAMAHVAEPIREIHVSDRGHFGFTRLSAAQEGVPALGYVAAARQIGAALNAALLARDDIDLIAPARVTAVFPEVERVRVQVSIDGAELEHTARLLVAADGGQSFVREALGFRTRRWEYGASAVVANLSTERPHQGVAFERFTDQGPVALLPMREARCALVWTVAEGELDAVLGYDDETFLARFQDRFGYRLGRFTRVGRRTGYPLSFLRVLDSVGQRVAVIGNAAHTLHPIAGQGLNLGVRDVAALAEVVADAQRAGGDPGGSETLAAYERWRRRDQQRVAFATDGLARLFANPLPPLRLARNLGMLALDALPVAKHRLARAAMGVGGPLPRLARGVRLD